MFLLNKWWAIAESKTIRNKAVGLRRLGEDLVLWRNQQGKIICQSSQCPHRGADLANGRVIDGCIECPYHGFRYASEGNCTLMPYEGKKAHISLQMRVNTYIVQEAHDLVWLWWGENQSDYPPIPWFDSLHDSPVRWASGTRDWDVHFTRTAESMFLDLYHLAFAHRRSSRLLGLGFGSLTRFDLIDMQVDGEIIHTWAQLRPETETFSSKGILNFRHTVYFPSLALFDLEFDAMKFFAIATLKYFAIATPIDEENTWTYGRMYVEYGTPWISRLIAKVAVWVALTFLQPEDYKIIRSSQPKQSSLRVNNFVNADKCLVYWHKLYENSITRCR